MAILTVVRDRARLDAGRSRWHGRMLVITDHDVVSAGEIGYPPVELTGIPIDAALPDPMLTGAQVAERFDEIWASAGTADSSSPRG